MEEVAERETPSDVLHLRPAVAKRQFGVEAQRLIFVCTFQMYFLKRHFLFLWALFSTAAILTVDRSCFESCCQPLRS